MLMLKRLLLLFTLLACDTFIHQRLRWANVK